jgi:hypothetical protein
MAVVSAGNGVAERGRETRLGALDVGTLKNVALVRIASAGEQGATRADVRRDLAPLIEHRLSPAEWRRELDALLLALLEEGCVRQARMRIAATRKGADAVRRFLGTRLPQGADWGEVRDVLLVARALGLEAGPRSGVPKLGSALGLRKAILEKAFGVSAKGADSIVAVRDALARKVAPKAQGKALSKGRTAETRRAIAQLLRRPRDFETDEALVAELAAEQVGAIQTSAPSLRIAILRRLLGKSSGKGRASGKAAGAAPTHSAEKLVPMPAPVNGHALAAPTPARTEPAPGNGAAHRTPDLAAFARAVAALAAGCAEGWPGNRRAFISRVWYSLQDRHPEWGLSIAAYKDRLTEAHKAGHLTLAYADLRDAANIGDVRESAIQYRNTEWHFIRVED